MLKDLKELPQGSVLMISVKDTALTKSKPMNDDLKNYLAEIGSQNITSLAFREGWAFIHITGTQIYTEQSG